MTALRAARKAQNLTQFELAKRTGCAQSYISMLEQGLEPSRSDIAGRIAAVLGVPVDALFTKTTD